MWHSAQAVAMCAPVSGQELWLKLAPSQLGPAWLWQASQVFG